MRFRFWSETLGLDALASGALLSVLAAHQTGLLCAVRPAARDQLGPLLDAAAAAGVSVGLWPMLDDHHGRWINATNTDAASDFVGALLDRYAHHESLTEIALDLEPPFGLVARLTNSLPREARPQATLPWSLHPRATERSLARLIARIHRAGLSVTAAAVPLVLLDPAGGGTFEWALGTPVDRLDFDRVSVMLYTSMFEGWSWGMVSRRGARSLLRLGAEAALRRYQHRASVSLGAIATGALGDEPVYRNPDELADDLAVVRDVGITDVALFDLGGAVARGPVTRWLGALGSSHRARVVPHRSHRLGWHLGAAVGRALPLFLRRFQQSSG